MATMTVVSPPPALKVLVEFDPLDVKALSERVKLVRPNAPSGELVVYLEDAVLTQVRQVVQEYKDIENAKLKTKFELVPADQQAAAQAAVSAALDQFIPASE